MKKLVFLIQFIIIALQVLRSQDVTVTASFDSSRIYIGDQIFFSVVVDQPKDIYLNIKSFRDTLCKNIEILGGPLVDSTESADNRLRITGKYLVTSFDSGFYNVPPVYAEVKSESGIKRFYSGYSPLEVMRVRIAPQDTASKIFDIVKPYRAPVTAGEILPWLLAGLLAAALVWGIYLISRKFFKKKSAAEPVLNPDPAHVIAFRELEELRLAQLWQRGEVKQYYSRLTEILRRYLENRYGVFSLEMTTSETLEALVKTGFRKDNNYNDLKSILNGADLVKFAKYKPEPSENDLHFNSTWNFIEMTMEKEKAGTMPDDNRSMEVKS